MRSTLISLLGVPALALIWLGAFGLGSLVYALPGAGAVLKQCPDIVDVAHSELFKHAFVSECTVSGYTVRFPVGDRTVVEYVSERPHRQPPCSEELEPGWYRSFPCRSP